MAASLSIKLIHPVRIWIGINLLMLGILSAAAWGIWHISSSETQTLVDVQRDTIVRSRIDDLVHGRFRDVIEGTGARFSELYFEITSEGDRFTFGKIPNPSRCSSVTLQNDGFKKPLMFKICRPFTFPISALASIIAFYVLGTLTSFIIIARTERRAVNDLATFVESQGVSIDRSGGFVSVLSRIKEIVSDLKLAKRLETEFAKSEAVAKMAKQVAHDIRSPLTALEMATTRLVSMPNQERGMIQDAVIRIREIANDLQSAKIQNENELRFQGMPVINSELKVEHLNTIVDSIIAEKRAEFADRIGLKIENATHPADQSLALKVDPASFKRALSNIINNAVEAIARDGRIQVSAYANGHDTVVRVSDNGKGIDPTKLSALFTSKPTSDKIGGQGLGLLQAKQMAQRAGGILRLESKVAVGTMVEIVLPRLRSITTLCIALLAVCLP